LRAFRKKARSGVLERLLAHARADIGHVRAKLERAGTPIGPPDTLIAAQAVARELRLVSNNEREFGRVSGLAIEKWARG
jgi:tRNA(fMet)-specific endonuclease VapC